MLSHLHIENYALIKELDLKPNKNLNIITGETGAGKSIMLGALGLLLGNRADTKVLLDTSRKCIIEGTFEIEAYGLSDLFQESDMDYDSECIIRREISPSGKSRAFVNDGVTNLDFLRALGERLMDVHSQHDTLKLESNLYQLGLIDGFAQNTSIKSDYQAAFKDFKEKERIFNELVHESGELRKEADYNQFLFDELDKANLTSDEQEILEDEVKKLENAEEIKVRLNEAIGLIDQGEPSLNSMIFDLKSTLSQISGFSESYASIKDRVESILIELKDLSRELEVEEGSVEYDPKKTSEKQERLSLIYRLQQKHQVSTIQDLQEILERLSDKVLKVENLDEAIEAARKAKEDAFEGVMVLGTNLTESRISILSTFSSELTGHLSELGMPDATIKIDHEAIEPAHSGIDRVNILFSANKGIPPQPLKQAASGGEFSRLMFGIKYILADKMALPTIVFDEIDTGVSGEIAIKMAQMMNQMADNHQVVTITHLPQIAAKGGNHYFVYKDNESDITSSRIKHLSEEERVNEIAQMIGGANPSEKAVESARELMAL